MIIEEGKRVSLDYVLIVDGEVIDTSKQGRPLQYTHGEGEIIPGLSKQLERLGVGDEKNIEVLPQEAYGELDPDACREIRRSQLPPIWSRKSACYYNLPALTAWSYP